MKLSAPIDTFTTAVSRVARAASSASPTTAGIRVAVSGSHAVLTATDTEVVISARIPVTSDEDAVVVLPADMLASLLRTLRGDTVTLAGDTSKSGPVTLTSGAATFSINAIPTDTFPNVTENTESGPSVPASDLLDAIAKVAPAASKDRARAALCGVLLEPYGDSLSVVATDSYRLAVANVTVGDMLAGRDNVLLAAKDLTMVQSLFKGADSIEVRISDQVVTFAADNTRLTTRMLPGNFPPWRSLVAIETPVVATIGREEALAVVESMRVIAGTAPVALDFDTEGVTLSASARDRGEGAEMCYATLEGADAFKVAVNPEYLGAALKAFDADDLVLSMQEPTRPFLVTAEDSNITYVLMPVSV